MGTSIVDLNQKIELPPIQALFESLNQENEPKLCFEEHRVYRPKPSFIPRTNIAVGSPVNPVPVSSPVFFIGPSPAGGVHNNAMVGQGVPQFPTVYKNREVIPTGARDYVIAVGRPPVSSLQPKYERMTTSDCYQNQRLSQSYACLLYTSRCV